jgi:hypothetical protein
VSLIFNFILVPGHVETTYKLAHFERRHAGVEKGEEVLNSAIDAAKDPKPKGFLIASKAKYLYAVSYRKKGKFRRCIF